jgi:hypothetical protein
MQYIIKNLDKTIYLIFEILVSFYCRFNIEHNFDIANVQFLP